MTPEIVETPSPNEDVVGNYDTNFNTNISHTQHRLKQKINQKSIRDTESFAIHSKESVDTFAPHTFSKSTTCFQNLSFIGDCNN